ncbi:MAG: hypothetical protein ACRD36_12525, partial [Candidatus Acidiferrum sp.]
MLGFAWLGLRQARSALHSGRLDDAQRLLREAERQGRSGTAALVALLARAYVERGERQVKLEDLESAWRDLLAAESLQTGEKGIARLRETLARLGVAAVRTMLQAGDPVQAEQVAERLRSRQVRSPDLQVLEDGGRGWIGARELADRAEFAKAVETADRARRLLGPIRALDEWREQLEQRRKTFADLQGRLQDAVNASRWSEALEFAEQVLLAAPEHSEARKIRTQAWKAMQPLTV